MTYVVIWGLVSITAAIIGGVAAFLKNRDHSSWAAWCFVFPPFVIALLLTPKNTGPPPAPRRLGDDGDRDHGML